MSRVVLFLGGALFASVALAESPANSPDRPHWFSDYGAALEATKADRKPLLVVLDDPSQERLRVEQVSRPQAADASDLLQPYTLCRVDVTTPYGREVARRFRARQFPTTAIIDREGRTLIFTQAGRFSDEAWRATLAEHRDGRVVQRVRYAEPAACFT